MIFSSTEFLLIFLPLFLVLYSLAPRKMKNVILLSGSLVFYVYGEPKSLLILMLSVLVNYFFGLHLGRGAMRKEGREGDKYNSKYGDKRRRQDRRRKGWLIAAVTYNVAVLVGFKYGIWGEGLPLGMSFYTFQMLSYLIDVYGGKYEREISFLHLATYMTMFPQLLSGPLTGYDEQRGSLYSREYGRENVEEGLKVFTLGLAEKVLLADRVGLLWNEVQVTGVESVSMPLAWMAAIAYSMRIYFDFNGYSLMAIGLGRMLGFQLPENFRDPYMATSVRDFYRRWHITLGRWFGKYVYIPLGGNRKGMLRTVRNLMAVWFLTAVWHGSTANFLIWGGMLCAAIVLERLAEASGLAKYGKTGVGRLFSHFYVWILITVSWVCFAATDIEGLQVYLGRMFGVVPAAANSAVDWKNAFENYGLLLAAGAFACTPWLGKLFQKCKDGIPGMAVLAALFWLCVWMLQREGQNPFLYLGF